MLRLWIVFVCMYFLSSRFSLASRPPSEWKLHPSWDDIRSSCAWKPLHSRCSVARVENHSFERENETSAWFSLGFITPWNHGGKVFVEECPCDFQAVSPCWVTLKRVQKDFVLEGGSSLEEISSHRRWIRRMENLSSSWCGKKIQILPRIHFDSQQWNEEDYRSFWMDEAQAIRTADDIVSFIRSTGAHGVVLDWGYFDASRFSRALWALLRGIRSISSTRGSIRVIVVIPAPRGNGFSHEDFRKYVSVLHSFVDYLSLLTYDFSGGHSNAPMAPISWIRESIDSITDNAARSKLLVGVNCYGYLSVNGIPRSPFTGSDLCNLATDTSKSKFRSLPRFKFDHAVAEHRLRWIDQSGLESSVSFPTPEYIRRRAEASFQHHAGGISVWELGQCAPFLHESKSFHPSE